MITHDVLNANIYANSRIVLMNHQTVAAMKSTYRTIANAVAVERVKNVSDYQNLIYLNQLSETFKKILQVNAQRINVKI